MSDRVQRYLDEHPSVKVTIATASAPGALADYAERSRRAAADMCPDAACRAAGQCTAPLSKSGRVMGCRLKPPLDALASPYPEVKL